VVVSKILDFHRFFDIIILGMVLPLEKAEPLQLKTAEDTSIF